jgi:hypothetical protein
MRHQESRSRGASAMALESPMPFTNRVRMLVWGKAAGRCSFSACRKELAIAGDIGQQRDTILGEFAHNVAETSDGPRGKEVPPGGHVDAELNALLLCPNHHTEIDRHPRKYTVERLIQLKADHEIWVRDQLSVDECYAGAASPEQLTTEQVHSTLLPVVAYPSKVYSVPCTLGSEEIRSRLKLPAGSGAMIPYVVRDQFYTFYNIAEDRASISGICAKGAQIDVHSSEMWWSDDDRQRLYVELLNRTMNKLTGRLGLNLDREHHRYYFEPDGTVDQPISRSVSYKSLTGRRENRKVAWRPQFRHSGEFRKYWEHMAVGLRFHRVAKCMWVLSVRPERRFTFDGWKPITPRGTGRRATSRKAKMYNEKVLVEVNFWRTYLSGARPRIICDFGGQSLMIGAELLHADIRWPGVPDDALPFTDSVYEEDLFTIAEISGLGDPGAWDDE